jgi:hypothetical protein
MFLDLDIAVIFAVPPNREATCSLSYTTTKASRRSEE